jgi:hypothetical protein
MGVSGAALGADVSHRDPDRGCLLMVVYFEWRLITTSASASAQCGRNSRLVGDMLMVGPAGGRGVRALSFYMILVYAIILSRI